MPARTCTMARSSMPTDGRLAHAMTAWGDLRRTSCRISTSSLSGSGTDIRIIAWVISSGSDANHGDAYVSSTATKHRCFSRPAPIPNRHSRTRATAGLAKDPRDPANEAHPPPAEFAAETAEQHHDVPIEECGGNLLLLVRLHVRDGLLVH